MIDMLIFWVDIDWCQQGVMPSLVPEQRRGHPLICFNAFTITRLIMVNTSKKMWSDNPTYINKERRINDMQDIRNVDGKLVCRLDKEAAVVEIVHKGCKTLIRLKPDGTTEIINTQAE